MTVPVDLPALLAALPYSLLRDLQATATAGTLLAARIDTELQRRRDDARPPDTPERRGRERMFIAELHTPLRRDRRET